MKRRSGVKNWWKLGMEHMVAKSTTRSLKVEIGHGTLLPPLGQAVVLRSTRIDKLLPEGSESSETVRAVLAILTALLRETLSSDVMELSLSQAEHVALAGGVSQSEFDRVKKGVVRFWADRKAQNPLASMF
jgi:hypothetical protein